MRRAILEEGALRSTSKASDAGAGPKGERWGRAQKWSGLGREPQGMNEEPFEGTRRFSVIRRLGAGGAGVVYEAHDSELGARVALKRLKRLSPAAILSFKNEFRAIEDVERGRVVTANL